MDWGFVAFDFKVFCTITTIDELYFSSVETCVSVSTLKTAGPGLPFLDIQPHFACDLPLSSLQLLLMPVSGLWKDGPPDGSSCSSLPKDQLTSISAAKRRCEIKYWILIVCFWEAGHKWRKKKRSISRLFSFLKLGLLVVRTLNVLEQTATFVLQIQKLRQTVFCVKHIQISCSVSLVSSEWWPNTAQLTQLWRQIWKV